MRVDAPKGRAQRPAARPPRARRFVHVAWVRFRALPVNWNDELSLRAACADCGDAAGLAYSWDLFLVNATEGSRAEGRRRPPGVGSILRWLQLCKCSRREWRVRSCPRSSVSPTLRLPLLIPAPSPGCVQAASRAQNRSELFQTTGAASPRPTPPPGRPCPPGQQCWTPQRGSGGQLGPCLDPRCRAAGRGFQPPPGSAWLTHAAGRREVK